MRVTQNGCQLAHIFRCIFLTESLFIMIQNSLKFIHKDPINNKPALGHIMALRRTGDKPLSEPVMAQRSDALCVTRQRWSSVTKHFNCMRLQVSYWSTICCHADSKTADKYCQLRPGCIAFMWDDCEAYVVSLWMHKEQYSDVASHWVRALNYGWIISQGISYILLI